MTTATGAPRVRREALHRLAAPVAVVTVRHEGRPHGTTVSSVTRVSRTPLLMGVCLRGGSAFAGLAAAEGRFVINVLDSGQQAVARWFADRCRPDGQAQFAGLTRGDDIYAKAPRLHGALAHYSCRVAGLFAVGDHEVLLGQVVRADHGAGEPLLSYAGGLFAAGLTPAPGS
ncbi:NADPH-flavin oxidoreductase [Streptomyces griseoflavus]|uniref:flavin reductase family protein n=1 Tax=Streptomyces rimosus TaxID=1927 RepID=UPI0004C61B66|nr:flavin reductase family protein [Streptomyces rimosus]KOG64536.1 NADPH-flavin oxidoreductase [Streptomyces griseoflavus]